MTVGEEVGVGVGGGAVTVGEEVGVGVGGGAVTVGEEVGAGVSTGTAVGLLAFAAIGSAVGDGSTGVSATSLSTFTVAVSAGPGIDVGAFSGELVQPINSRHKRSPMK